MYFGCGAGFLTEPDFWEEEGDAPVMNLNNNFLSAGRDNSDLYPRLKQWLSDAGATPAFIAEQKQQFEAFAADFVAQKTEPDRIFVKDAVRTFRSEKHQTLLIHMLSYMQTQFNGDYHQGVCLKN